MRGFLGASSSKTHPGGCALVVLVPTTAARSTATLVVAPDHVRPDFAKYDANENEFAGTTHYTRGTSKGDDGDYLRGTRQTGMESARD